MGQAPSRASGPVAFDGRSGRRVAELCGAPELPFRAVNLVERWPGPSRGGKGDAFPMDQARRGALRVARLIARERPARVLLAGRRVAEAFGWRGAPLLAWAEAEVLVGGRPVAEVAAAVIPHPSGVSRWWNDPANEGAARAFLADLAEGLDMP